MAEQLLRWEQRRVSDDQGSPARPAMVEHVYIARAVGFEWMVAKHDDDSWNWFMLDGRGEPQAFQTDFPTAEAAQAAAKLAAAQELATQ